MTRLPLLCLLLCTTLHAQTITSSMSVADFEGESIEGIEQRNLTLQRGTDAAPQGQAYLRMTLSGDAPRSAYVRLPVAGQRGLADSAALVAQVRAPGARQEVALRWLALDGQGRPIFQRRFVLQPGEQWVRIEEPLRTFRWDARFVGDRDEVRELALRIDSETPRVDLDAVQLVGEADPSERREWLLKIAFEDRPHRVAVEQGLLVASDAVEGLSDEDLAALLRDMVRARAFIRRVFGEAVRPTDENGPAALLIFKDPAQHQAFFQRLGEAWRVEIRPPSHQGYTVQDIATSTWRADAGPRRPVYLHEAVHAIVARDLRLQSGHPPHSPMQEAIANYIQVCVYPQSLPRRAYVEQFGRPIDPAGNGFFKPLATLFADRADTKEYAQLASVFAYLSATDPKLLAGWARRLADGVSPAEALEQAGGSWEKLQAGWFSWGQQHFADSGSDAPAFDLPAEFR